MLERLDPNPEYWEGKRGACIGCFQMIIAGKEPIQNMREVLGMLQNTNNPQMEQIARIMRKWASTNGMPV